MKKFFAIWLSLIILISLFCAYAFAEAIEPVPEPAPASSPMITINLTGLVVAILVAFFEILLAWLLKAVVPPLKKWLDSHTTKNQQAVIWNVVKRLVEAAEQIIIGEGKGAEKLEYVRSALEAHGYTIDLDMIEAAVKEMNDKLLYNIEDCFEFIEDPNNSKDNLSDNTDGDNDEE